MSPAYSLASHQSASERSHETIVTAVCKLNLTISQIYPVLYVKLSVMIRDSLEKDRAEKQIDRAAQCSMQPLC